jgi:hypothetical protein
LWIASTTRKPRQVDISTLEQRYEQLYAARGDGAPPFPDTYPTSSLLGAVRLVDCVDAPTYAARLPQAELREENTSPFLFLLEGSRRLPTPLQHRGKHRMYRLEAERAANAHLALPP